MTVHVFIMMAAIFISFFKKLIQFWLNIGSWVPVVPVTPYLHLLTWHLDSIYGPPLKYVTPSVVE